MLIDVVHGCSAGELPRDNFFDPKKCYFTAKEKSFLLAIVMKFLPSTVKYILEVKFDRIVLILATDDYLLKCNSALYKYKGGGNFDTIAPGAGQ